MSTRADHLRNDAVAAVWFWLSETFKAAEPAIGD